MKIKDKRASKTLKAKAEAAQPNGSFKIWHKSLKRGRKKPSGWKWKCEQKVKRVKKFPKNLCEEKKKNKFQ